MSDLEAKVRELETRLAAVEAVQEIHNLKAHYGALVDARYGDAGPLASDAVAALADRIAELFTPDATWDGGADLGVCRGRDAIRQRFLEPTLGFTLHYFVKPHIAVTGDSATGRWDILAPLRFANGRPGWMAGTEHDTYARHEGQWRHTAMKLDIAFIAPHSRGW